MPPKPRVQIPAHVFVYTIGFLPGVAYAYYWYKNAPTEEEIEEKLRKNYSHNIETSREKRVQMTNFLQNIKDPNSDQSKQMDKVLLGGRGQQKRLYAVDETIYGTEEGAKLQKDAQQKAKKKKRKKKKKSATPDEGNVDENVLGNGVKQSVAAVAVVGALAAGASFFLGGKRS
mmetsp:Transcript_13598/g.29564  ORF Transcript_13598/g.29564 Transcript_13598/m.29564 type:complete len:173 (-) Transcript_13598:163-681(-)|eukprot:CAMPEP_0172314218 /NCGR_PEP_ID=MMETSP1058-20130122/21974_1 /TAXON_ID=83371 /ORGANISM="Detonula confervacea, Strain CCMP 353" /LENGTH=172 /DNA_ID=CAMNT_0013028027 /DNA_START=27 /DNA_END=545 /DNA_ORIENTATION=+